MDMPGAVHLLRAHLHRDDHRAGGVPDEGMSGRIRNDVTYFLRYLLCRVVRILPKEHCINSM